MYTLNKRQMMLAISVSLMAYAFAISGCGQKDSPDKDTKAANLAATNSLVGNWAATPQSVKTTQSNLNILTITKTNIKLRTVCLIDATDKDPAVSTAAEIANDFSVDEKHIKFDRTASAASPDSKDCAASLAAGKIKFELDKDGNTLTLSMKSANGKEKTEFKKIAAEKLTSLESDFKTKSTAAQAAIVKGDAAATPALSPEIIKANANALLVLKGIWISKTEDLAAEKVLGAKLKKTNYDLVAFSESMNRFNERIACHYVTSSGLAEDIGILINKVDLPDQNSGEPLTDVQKNGISYEAVSGQQVIKIKSSVGNQSIGLKPETISLTDDEAKASLCQVTYLANQSVTYSISADNDTLTLIDDSNLSREFKRFDKSKASDELKASHDLIMSLTKKKKSNDDSKKDAPAPAAPATAPAPAPADVATPQADAATKPADASTAQPAETITPPADATTKAADATAKPADAAVKPADTTAKPADTTKNPAEDSAAKSSALIKSAEDKVAKGEYPTEDEAKAVREEFRKHEFAGGTGTGTADGNRGGQ